MHPVTSDREELTRSINELTSSDTVTQLAESLGEPTENVSRACVESVRALTVSVASLAGGVFGPSSISAWLAQGAKARGRFGPIGEFASDPVKIKSVSRVGTQIASGIFGGTLPNASEAIRKYAGIKAGTAATVLAVLSAEFAALLEEIRSREGLDESGVIDLVRRHSLTAATSGGPAPRLTRPNPIGGSLLEPALQNLQAALVRNGEIPPGLRRNTRDYKPAIIAGASVALLVLIAAVLVLFYLRPLQPRTYVPTVTPPNDGATNRSGAALKQFTEFAAAGSATALPKVFTMEGVAFYADSNRMRPDAAAAVDQYGAVLKTFPALQVRIVGHIENARDTSLQKQLALDRAHAVKARLEAMGVDGLRMLSEGVLEPRVQEGPSATSERALANRTELVITRVR